MTTTAAARPTTDSLRDGRDARQYTTERQAVERELATWRTLRTDADLRRGQLRLLQQRRHARPDLHQFDILPLGPDHEVLTARGEILMRREDATSALTQRILATSGLRVRPVEGLAGRVVRVVGRQLRSDAAATVRRLRARGLPVSYSYVTAMNPWIKGLSGPAPSAGARVFPTDQRASGRGVPVAVIDTGITGARRTDGWLESIPRRDNIDPLDDLPEHGNGTLDIGAGHGTFVAGVLQQVAPTAQLTMYRAVDPDGIGSELGVAHAMIRAAEDGATIINLSLGTNTADDQPPIALAAATELIAEEFPHVLIVAAAGNDGHTRPCWPAALPGVVAVAGLTPGSDASVWSNHGNWITCSTVGEGVVSTFVRGRKAGPDGGPDVTYGPDPWATWTGTSFAAPQITGAIAHTCSTNPHHTPHTALTHLIKDTPTIPGYGPALRVLPGT